MFVLIKGIKLLLFILQVIYHQNNQIGIAKAKNQDKNILSIIKTKDLKFKT